MILLFTGCASMQLNMDKTFFITCPTNGQQWIVDGYEIIGSSLTKSSTYSGIKFKSRRTGKDMVIYGPVIIEEL